MFNKTKFKKGDKVQLLNNLESYFFVLDVYNKDDVEMVVLSNNHSYCACDITFYSEPINRLKRLHDSNLSIIQNLTKKLEETNKELSELKDKILKKNDYSFPSNTYASLILGRYWGYDTGLETKEEEKVKTLEERIEELEAKLTKNVKTPKVKKTKKNKKK